MNEMVKAFVWHIYADAVNELKNRDSMVLKFNETENNFIKYPKTKQQREQKTITVAFSISCSF